MVSRFLLSTLLFVAASVVAVVQAADESYIVTIDGGSSGSRVHIHKVAAPTDSNPIPTIISSINQKIKPGLSSFKDNPSDVQGHVKGLIDFALESVPQAEWSKTPLFLKATAGLRSIPVEASNQIMAVVRGNFAATPFVFQPDWARVITGTEEGMYSWIAVNYLKGRFGQTEKPLLGVIEMGGASMQISYPLPQVVEGKDVVQVSLGANTYHLFAHSFLGYGLDKAQEILTEKDPENIGTCYLNGYETDSITGRGDYGTCYQAMDKLMGKSQCPTNSSGRCAMNGKILPEYGSVDFVAIENFFYTSEFLKTQDNIAAMPSKGQDFCSLDWDNAKGTYPDEDVGDLTRYCFSAAFITSVLEKGFEVPSSRIEVTRTIGDSDIDWPIGSVIHDMMLHFPTNSNSSGLLTTKSDEIQVFVLIVGFILLAGAFVSLRRKKKARDYL